MADIVVTVSGTPSSPSYSGTPSGKVESSGKVKVNPGTSTIQFTKAAGVSWTFNASAISFDDSGPFTVTSQDASQVTISDTDPTDHPDNDLTYEYTLHTSAGDFDPQILNKGKA